MIAPGPPIPTSHVQALRMVLVLSEWAERGWEVTLGGSTVWFTDPEHPKVKKSANGSTAFHALCHATTIMGILLEEHPTALSAYPP